MKKAAALISRLASERRGSMLVEAAISLPVLLLLLAASIEMGRFFIANQKMAGLASAMADMAAQAENTLAESEINDLFAAIDHVSRPFDVENAGRVIISGIVGTGNGSNVIAWQRCSGQLSSAVSRLGSEGAQNVVLPGNIVLADLNDVSVFAEVHYQYEALMFDSFLPAQDIATEAIFRPRFGAITTLLVDDAPSNC